MLNIGNPRFVGPPTFDEVKNFDLLFQNANVRRSRKITKARSSKPKSLRVKPFAEWRAPHHLGVDCIQDVLESLGTVRSLTVSILLKYKQHSTIMDLSVDPLLYLEHESARFDKDLIASSIVSKSKWLKTDIDKKATAKKKFLECEMKCEETNQRFSPVLRGDELASGFDLTNENIRWCLSRLSVAARKIDQMLPQVPDYARIFDDAGWGPGVTTLLRGNWCNHTNKFRSETGITRDALSVVRHVMPLAYPIWELEQYVPCKGSKVSFVPKNAKTDRIIAIEPGLNLWFQRGIGRQLRSALRKEGIDLNDQRKNAELARQGSINGLIATVDFSSASDTVSRSVVQELLPKVWYDLLDTFRCKVTEFEGEPVRLEKFSSMGNGFTFELESLIFYSLARAVCPDGVVSVFGDDVIIPTDSYDDFVRLSEFCGFTINTDKSFKTSCYRESCGSHWFNGVDCKPAFQREKLVGLPQVYQFANQLTRLARRHPRISWVRDKLENLIPHYLRLYGPEILGDGCLHHSTGGYFPSPGVSWDRENQCFKVAHLVYQSDTRTDDSHALLLARLYGLGCDRDVLGVKHFSPFADDVTISDIDQGNAITSRGSYKLSIQVVPTSQWDAHLHVLT